MSLKELSKPRKIFLEIIGVLIIIAILSALLGARVFFMWVIGLIMFMISFIPKVVYQRKMKDTPAMLIFTASGAALMCLAIATGLFANSNPGIMVTLGMYFFAIIWIIFGVVLVIKAKGNKKVIDMAEEYEDRIEAKNNKNELVVEPVYSEEETKETKGKRLMVIIGVICIFTGVISITLINFLLGNMMAIQ